MLCLEPNVMSGMQISPCGYYSLRDSPGLGIRFGLDPT